MLADPTSLRGFFDYVIWADRMQFDATRSLSDEAYFKDHGWSFGTIHGVMLHMLAAQEIWLQRFEGRPMHWLAIDPNMTSNRAAVESTWADIHKRFAAFLDVQTAESLRRELRWTNTLGKSFATTVLPMLVHALNHSGVHRGQLNSMIKLSGGAPPAVDYSVWHFATQPASA